VRIFFLLEPLEHANLSRPKRPGRKPKKRISFSAPEDDKKVSNVPCFDVFDDRVWFVFDDCV